MVNLASFYRKYHTESRDLTIHGRQFSFVIPKKVDPLTILFKLNFEKKYRIL